MSLIAIDGPGGSGKSSVARALALRLGIDRLDTGAMYRAVALATLEAGVDPSDAAALGGLAASLEFELVGDVVCLGDRDVTSALRTPAIDAIVSEVAAHPAVRRVLVEAQRAWVVAHGSGVVEGRDIGSVVLPDADLKVYLTANEAVRARRRADEADRDADEVASSIAKRDAIDAGRADSPLVVAPGALVIDSSELSIDDVVDVIVQQLATTSLESVASSADVASPSTVPPTTATAVPGDGAADRGHNATRRLPVDAEVRAISRGELVLYGLCRAIAVGVSRLWYPGRVVGRENLPRSGPYLLAPIHRSNVDWLIVARVTRRRLRYIVKGEVWKVKAVGRFIELLGCFPVHRGVADREALNTSVAILAAGEPLVVFPEGTRGSGPVVGELREGAAYLALRANVPVVPVGMSRLETSMPRGAKFPRPTRTTIVVGPPILPLSIDGRSPTGTGRVPRAATHAMNELVRSGIQAAFDAAEGRTPGALAATSNGAGTRAAAGRKAGTPRSGAPSGGAGDPTKDTGANDSADDGPVEAAERD